MREKHRQLHGIIKPIDDAFWDRWYPPSDWRCRCDVVATAEPVTNENIDQLPKPEFQGNVGKNGEIFRKNGSFFRLIAGDEQALRNQELAKLNAPYERYRTPKGNIVRVSIFADRNEPEFTENIKVAAIIADVLGFKVRIRPHILIDKHPNPEYSINNKIADRKAPLGLSLRRVLGKASKQGSQMVVIDLKDNPNSIDDIIEQLRGNFRLDTNYQAIQEVIIISKDRKEVKYLSRKDIKKKGE